MKIGRFYSFHINALWKLALAIFLMVMSTHAGLAKAEESNLNASVSQKIATFTDAQVEELNFSGSILVSRGTEILFEKSYGFTDSKGQRPNLNSSLYRIGSITKQFTAASILLLEEQGKLKVSDALSQHLKEYPVENLSKNGVQVTLHHLLTHTSGIPDFQSTNDWLYGIWNKNFSSGDILNAIASSALASVPGKEYRYNNTGYDILGMVIERVSGMPLAQFEAEFLFPKAGLNHTGFVLAKEHEEYLSQGQYLLAGVGFNAKKLFNFVFDHSNDAFGASGGLHSSTEDLHKWTLALHNGGVLKPESLKKMLTPVLENYGYGIIKQGASNELIYWHSGAISPLGYVAYLNYSPKMNDVVLVLSNHDIQNGDKPKVLSKGILDILQGKARLPEKSVFDFRLISGTFLGIVFLAVFNPWFNISFYCYEAYSLWRRLKKPVATERYWHWNLFAGLSDFAFMSIFFAKGSWKILVSFLIVFAIISFVFKKGRCIYPETRVPVFFWLYPVLTFCAFAAIKPSAFIFNFAAMLGIYLIARKIKILNRI